MKRALRTLSAALLLLLLGPPLLLLVVWSAGVLYYTFPVETLQAPAAVLFAAACLASMTLTERRWRAAGWVLAANAVVIGWFVSIRPSNDREWRPELARTPWSEFAGDTVAVHDIRSFDFRGPDGFEARYHDETFDLSALQAVDLLYTYRADDAASGADATDGALAHTLVSWDFGGEDVLCLSIEPRCERGEAWGAVPGLFKQFEVLYVLADERDLVRQRASARGEQVLLSRTVLGPEDGRRLLVHVLERCNELRRRPRFYCTLGANGTTSLLGHLEAVWPQGMPLTERLLMKGYGPEAARASGLHELDLPLDVWKTKHDIGQAARSAEQDPEFSRRIRAHLAAD